jgi:hypothetical protein
MLYCVHLAMNAVRIHILEVIGTDCTGSCKSNYHTITTTMAPINYVRHWCINVISINACTRLDIEKKYHSLILSFLCTLLYIHTI